MLLSKVVCNKKIGDVKKYTLIAGRFDGHAYVQVQCNAYCPMEHVHGFTRSHWMLPLGWYLRRIAPAAPMVIKFDVKKTLIKLYFYLAIVRYTTKKMWILRHEKDPLLTSSMQQAA
jgi:hypothetical protein